MTGVGVGEFTVFGVVEESAYGTPVTVSRFYEILPGETLEAEVKTRTSSALRGGTRNGLAATRDVKIGEAAKGGVKFEVSATNFGLLFKHLFGGVAITGGGAAKTHAYTTGTVLGKSMSAQKQVRDASNTLVKAFSYNGVKLLKGGFSINKDGVLELELTTDARQESDGVAAASASYIDPIPFAFSEGALTVGGSSVANVLTAKVDYENPAEVDRRFLGGSGFKSEPTDSDRPTAGGTLSAEFLDSTVYDLFLARTAAALSLTFTSTTVIPTTATPYSLNISIPKVYFNGSTPKVGSPGPVGQDLPFVGRVNAAGDPMVTLTYVTSDTVS